MRGASLIAMHYGEGTPSQILAHSQKRHRTMVGAFVGFSKNDPHFR